MIEVEVIHLVGDGGEGISEGGTPCLVVCDGLFCGVLHEEPRCTGGWLFGAFGVFGDEVGFVGAESVVVVVLHVAYDFPGGGYTCAYFFGAGLVGSPSVGVLAAGVKYFDVGVGEVLVTLLWRVRSEILAEPSTEPSCMRWATPPTSPIPAPLGDVTDLYAVGGGAMSWAFVAHKKPLPGQRQRLCFQFNEKDNLFAATTCCQTCESQQRKRSGGGLGYAGSGNCYLGNVHAFPVIDSCTLVCTITRGK